MEKWESNVSKNTSEDTQDSGVQFITLAGPRGIGSEQGPWHFRETRFYTLTKWLFTCSELFLMYVIQFYDM